MVQNNDEAGQSQSVASSRAFGGVSDIFECTTIERNTFKPTTFDDVPRPASKSECSCFSSIGHGYLTSLLSGRLQNPPLDHRFVHDPICLRTSLLIRIMIHRRRKLSQNPLRRANRPRPHRAQKAALPVLLTTRNTSPWVPNAMLR